MRAAVLLYHDVLIDDNHTWSGFAAADAAPYKMSKELFSGHLEALASAGVAPITVDQLPTQGLPVLLTFDDGGRSAAAPIASLLAEYGWKAHFFVTGDRIGQPGFLGAPEIRALRDAGHVIGAHSWSHPHRISDLPAGRLHEEWQRSVGTLEDILAQPIQTASVPGGFYSHAVAEAAWDAGIRALFTSEPEFRIRRMGDRLILGRFCLRNASSPAEAVSIARGAVLPRLRHYVGWNIRKLAKNVGGALYDRYRDSQLGRKRDRDT